MILLVLYTYSDRFFIVENWPDECFFSGLDSSLKRNNAFVKKLKTTFPVDQDGRVALLTELDQLNLVKFIDEVASALATTDRKFKVCQPIRIC